MNEKYSSAQALRGYMKKVKEDKALQSYEQEWTNRNFMPVIHLMGDHFVFQLYGVRVQELKGVTNTKRAYHSGKHWYARRPGDQKDFDPYDEYQIPGSNSFCQTFALMYALGKEPRRRPHTFERYYAYALEALHFIRTVIENLPDTYSYAWINKRLLDDENFHLGLSRIRKAARHQMLDKVDECIRHHYACINVAGVSPRELS